VDIELIGKSRNIKRIRELLDKVADTDINVLIHGETGVGKEVVAQELYKRSCRFGKPFIRVNCAALPDTLLESEMFGYERGAFTGAHRKMRGKFAQAHGGILFLDEIGDMSLALQSKLLHALQDGCFFPLGSETKARSDAWVIAATNHDLKKEVGEGAFREDLYYRLSCVTIYIEPLRYRPVDVPLLIDYYAGRYSNELSRDFEGFSSDVLNRLFSYHWPGNVRELQNVLKRLIVVGDHINQLDEMLRETPPSIEIPLKEPAERLEHLIRSANADRAHIDWGSFSLKKVSKEAAQIAERTVISYVLEQTGWNRTKAQKILKISYKTLLERIEKLNITPPPSQ